MSKGKKKFTYKLLQTQTLQIPHCIPKYSVKIETSRPHIKLKVKLIVNWIVKIIEMSKEQYPRIYFEIFKDLSSRKGSIKKFNWALQVKENFLFHKVKPKCQWSVLLKKWIHKSI